MITKILNSLIISDSAEIQMALEAIMQDNIEGYILSFMTLSLGNIGELDREPDLIFFDNNNGTLDPDEVALMHHAFPKKTSVVLYDDSTKDRRQFLNAGVDEVMSLSELRSPVGKHLLEKLLAFKDLADAEARVEQSEERFRGIIEHSHDIILLLDTDTTILYNSQAMHRQMQYEEWEVLGRPLLDFLHQDDRVFFEHQFKQVVEGTYNEAIALEFQFLDNAQRWRNLEAMATNLLNNNNVRAIVLNVRDVTEQKQTEVELEKYRLHLEELVEKRTREVEAVQRQADVVIAASPDALIALNNDGYITFISQHYRKIYPSSAHLLVPGKHVSEAFSVVTEEISLSSSDESYIEMNKWWLSPRGYKEYKMQNGTWVRLQAKRMEDGSGIVISSTNISDYKRQQALLAAQSSELAMALEKEKEVGEQQKTFIAMVSHEFRTPLTIIDGNAQIIQSRGETLAPAMLKTRAQTIRDGVSRLVHLIETILSVHMLEAGKLSVDPHPCDLVKIIRDAVSDQQDVSPNHRIKMDLRSIPDNLVLDEKVMRQIMVNLLANAVKYSPNAQEVDVMGFCEGDRVIIEVADHGLGIPESEMPKMFTKYFRASTSGGIPGSGLGLNIVKQFVELHGGDIALRSRVGVGTVVTVSLPIGLGV